MAAQGQRKKIAIATVALLYDEYDEDDVLYNNLEFYYNLEFQVVVRNLEIWVVQPNCQAGTNKCTKRHLH